MSRSVCLLIALALPALALLGGCSHWQDTLHRPGARYCCGVCSGRPGIKRCPVELAVGPSAGVIAGSPIATSPHFGVDLALGQTFFWGALGTRVDTRDGRWSGTVYAEGGLNTFLTYGVGVSTRFGADPTRVGPHLFLGFPIPFLKRWYLEPYYRPSFLFETRAGGEFGAIHEVGLMVKFWTHRADYQD